MVQVVTLWYKSQKRLGFLCSPNALNVIRVPFRIFSKSQPPLSVVRYPVCRYADTSIMSQPLPLIALHVPSPSLFTPPLCSPLFLCSYLSSVSPPVYSLSPSPRCPSSRYFSIKQYILTLLYLKKTCYSAE